MGIGWLRQRWDRLLWGRKGRNLVVETVRVALVALWKFRGDRGPVRASALAFVSALALVPLLAIIFSILQALGVTGQIEPFLVRYVTAGNAETAAKIVAYVHRVNPGALGLTGSVAFLVSALAVLHHAELAMNDVWGVGRGRTLVRKITDYIAMLAAAPVLLVVSTSLATTGHVMRHLDPTHWLGTAAPLALVALPIAAKCFAFTLCYLILPNRRVGLPAGVAGGAVAGLLWHGAEWGYIRFQISATHYNAVYGALAQLPVFLLWVYAGWCIVLFGAELACVLELPGRGRYLKGGEELWTPRLGLALAIAAAVARRFLRGEPAADEQTLVDDAGVHRVEGRRVVEALVRCGLLAYTDENPSRVVPARSPERTTVGEMVRRIAGTGQSAPSEESRFLAEAERRFADLTWSRWALDEDPPPEKGG